MKLSCPHCSASLNVPEEKIGKSAKCPRCENPLTITREEPRVPAVVRKSDTPAKPAPQRSHKWLWTSQGLLAVLCVVGLFFPRAAEQPAAASIVAPAPEMPGGEPPPSNAPQAMRVNSTGRFDIVRTQRIEIVGEDGGPSLIVGALPTGQVGLLISNEDAEEAASYLLVMDASGEITEMYLDHTGQVRLQQGLNRQGAAAVIFHGTEGAKRLILTSMADDVAGLTLFDSSGKLQDAFISE